MNKNVVDYNKNKIIQVLQFSNTAMKYTESTREGE